MLKTGHIDPQEAEHDARTLLSWQHERRTQLIVRKFDSQLVTLLYSVASPLVLLTTVNNNKQRKNKAASISFVVYGQKKREILRHTGTTDTRCDDWGHQTVLQRRFLTRTLEQIVHRVPYPSSNQCIVPALPHVCSIQPVGK